MSVTQDEMPEFTMKEAMSIIGEQHVVNMLNGQIVQRQAFQIIQLRARIAELDPNDPLGAPQEDNPTIAVAVDEDERVEDHESDSPV